MITVFVVLLTTKFNFTAIGHFSVIFSGLLLYPTRQRPRSVTAGSRSRS
ncbi:MAG TPA: hypothetical protein VII18_21820 [Mycobacterium sp.]